MATLGLIAMCGLSLAAVSGGCAALRGQAAHRGGFSLQSMGSKEL